MKTSNDNICDMLGDLIRKSLYTLIPNDYVLLDLPYYSNIGDLLIWQGTEDFLKELPGRNLGRHSQKTFNFRSLPKDCTILLLGGGNFGDIWRQHQDFRLKVIQTYPDNHIIILPQTIYYESDDIFDKDVRKMNQHHQLTICVRDHHSAESLKQKGFTGQVLTLPDMAFCIDRDVLCAQKSDITKDGLLLLRIDKEAPKGRMDKQIPPPEIDIEDWPNLIKSRHEAKKYTRRHTAQQTDTFFQTSFLPERISEGVRFVSEYKMVYSTRLHVAILRLLLGMPVKMMNNSYGKNLNFYNTWLKDCDLVSTPDEGEQRALGMAIYIQQQEQQQKKKRKKIRAIILTLILLVALAVFIVSLTIK